MAVNGSSELQLFVAHVQVFVNNRGGGNKTLVSNVVVVVVFHQINTWSLTMVIDTVYQHRAHQSTSTQCIKCISCGLLSSHTR